MLLESHASLLQAAQELITVILHRITGHALGSQASLLQIAAQQLLTVMLCRTTGHYTGRHASLLHPAAQELAARG